MSDRDSEKNGDSSYLASDTAHDSRVTISRDEKNELESAQRSGPPVEQSDVSSLARKTRVGVATSKPKRGGLSNEERALTPANIEAIQREKRAGLTNEEIRKLTGFSLGSISKHTKNIKVDPRAESPDPQGSASQPEPQPPMILDLNNGLARNEDQRFRFDNSPYGTYPPPRSNRLEASRREMLIDGDWERVRLLLLGDALRLGSRDPESYIREAVLPDLELARRWKEWMPGETNEQKDRSFQSMTRWALRFLQLRKEFLTSETDVVVNERN